MQAPTVRPMSLTEFLSLPERATPTVKQELVYGEVREMPRPTPRHNQLVLALGARLLNYLQVRGLGILYPDTLVVLDEVSGIVVAPDLAYFSPERLAQTRIERALYGVPNLVVEVLSPSTRPYDRGEKLELYHKAQVEWVWLIELEPLMVEEFHWSEAGYVLTQVAPGNRPFTPKLFPELSLTLESL